MSGSRRTPAIDPDDEAYCRDLVRTYDRDRYLCDLFAPRDLRPVLFVVHAFALETSLVPAKVSEPMLGALRLQWWRETIDRAGGGARLGNPLADALGSAIAAGAVTQADLDALIDAREAELGGAAAATLSSLEDHLARAHGIPLAQAARILAPGAAAGEAARHAGIALGLTAMLARLAEPRAPGTPPAQVPGDLLRVHGLAFIDPTTTEAEIRPVAADLVATARHALDRARGDIAGLAGGVLPAFLPLATVAADLRRMERAPLAGPRGPLRRQFAIYRAARRGRI